MEHTFWIWYPGDFELYHGMKQNFSRVERGFGWPAFWKSEGFRNRVAFRRIYELGQETSFTVFSNAIFAALIIAAYVLCGNTITDTFLLNLLFHPIDIARLICKCIGYIHHINFSPRQDLYSFWFAER